MTPLRLAARALSAISALLLAVFFIEHIEWFRDPRALPPARIFAATGFHLALICGLIMTWRWELPGALVAIGSGVGLVIAAGPTPRLVLTMAVFVLPAFLYPVARRPERTPAE